jgi:hypothetical protein
MALSSFGIQIERYWREVRPRMVADLERRGVLQKAIEAAQDLTVNSETDAIAAGATADQAREQFGHLWAFLPGEDKVPDLGCDPAAWNAKEPTHSNQVGWCTGEGVEKWRAQNKAERAHNKAERDALVARLKRRLSDAGNHGISHERFVAQWRGGTLVPSRSVDVSDHVRSIEEIGALPSKKKRNTWRRLPEKRGIAHANSIYGRRRHSRRRGGIQRMRIHAHGTVRGPRCSIHRSRGRGSGACLRYAGRMSQLTPLSVL